MGMEDYLAKGEKILYRTKGRTTSLVCTDRRIIYSRDKAESFKDVDYASISSIEWIRESKPAFRKGGALFFAFGIAMYLATNEVFFKNLAILSVFLAMLFFILYFALMHYKITFHTEKEEMTYDLRGAQAKDMVMEINRAVRRSR